MEQAYRTEGEDDLRGPDEELEAANAHIARRRRPNRITIFCPLEHRGTIKEMHRCIMCLHPMIPSPLHGNRYVDTEDIHRWATQEMYEYCKDNDLVLVWAYLWNQWYQPAHWKLWVRAAGNEIPRIRTTMMVESLWNTIKHTYLIDFNRPRLDLAIHLILRHALPTIRSKVAQLAGTWRNGRCEKLADWQKSFRAEWKRQSLDGEVIAPARQDGDDGQDIEDDPEDEEGNNDPGYASQIVWFDAEEPEGWTTILDRWVCSYPSFLLSRFLLCKHLVRMVNARLNLSPRNSLPFFAKLRRFHAPPFYRIDTIHPQLPDYARERRNGGNGDDDDDDWNGPEDQSPPEIDPQLMQPTLANPNPEKSIITRQTDSAADDAEPSRVGSSPEEMTVARNQLRLWFFVQRYFDQFRRQRLQRHFNTILKEIGPDQYLHHKHLDAMEKVIKGIVALGASLHKDDKSQRLRTTWREYDGYTVYRCR